MTTTKDLTTKTREISVKGIVFDHARIDTSHCLANGLFRPVMRGARSASPLDVTYTYKTFTFRWQNPSGHLCIKDQSVFLAIHRIAAPAKRTKRTDKECSDAIRLSAWDALELGLEATNLECLTIGVTAREIAHTLGLKISGPAISRIEESLERLASTSFSIYQKDSAEACWRAQLIGLAQGDGELQIAFNPMLSKALISTPTTFVDMDEVRILRTDAALRLLVWLSGWLRPCEGKRIGLDLLVKHIWGDCSSGDALYGRRISVKKALEEIDAKTAWDCKYDDGSKSAYVQRKKLGEAGRAITNLID
jgi:hypothetical protein